MNARTKATAAAMTTVIAALTATVILSCGGERKNESRAGEAKTAQAEDAANVETSSTQCDADVIYGRWRFKESMRVSSDGTETPEEHDDPEGTVPGISIRSDNIVNLFVGSFFLGNLSKVDDCNYVIKTIAGKSLYEDEVWSSNESWTLRYNPETKSLALKHTDYDLIFYMEKDLETSMEVVIESVRLLMEQISIAQRATQTPSSETFTDPRDGQTYRVVRSWFAENLNYQTKNSWCYNNDDNNCAKYGRLYTWDAARTACPPGWGLPTETPCCGDWSTLLHDVTDSAGMVLRSTTGWRTGSGHIPGSDELNFSALPGGMRVNIVSTSGEKSYHFDYIGERGCWWGMETDPEGAYPRYYVMSTSDAAIDVVSADENPDFGCSVRCVLAGSMATP